MEYKEIKKYYSSLNLLTYRIGGLTKREINEDGLGEVFPSWEKLYEELEKHPASEMCDELEILAATNSEEQFKRILKDLFVVTTQFEDNILNDFNDTWSDLFADGVVKMGDRISCIDVKRVQDIVGEKYADRMSEMIETTEEHLESLLFCFYRIIHAHLPDDWSGIKEQIETALTKMRGEGVEIKVDRLFDGSPVGLCTHRPERKTGSPRNPHDKPTLTVPQTCLYLRHRLDAKDVKSGIFGKNQAEDARILSAMCGGERNGFETELRKSWEKFKDAEKDKQKEKEITEELEKIEGIINRKED